MKYFIEPRLEKKWWKSEVVVVWDLKENYEYWSDLSYGNGGGDYVEAVKLIHTFCSKPEAERILKQLTEE